MWAYIKSLSKTDTLQHKSVKTLSKTATFRSWGREGGGGFWGGATGGIINHSG